MRNVLDKNMFFAKFKNVILAQFGEEEGNTLWENAGKISAHGGHLSGFAGKSLEGRST